MTTPRTRPNRTGSGRISAGLVTTLLLIAACTIPDRGSASDIPPVPEAPCDLGHRMNVEIIDGWMYECECVVLSNGFHCSWYLIGQTAPVSLRTRIKHHRITKKHRVITHYAIPGVVG